MDMTENSVELDYNMLLIKQLDRICALSIENFDDSSTKYENFYWAIYILEAIIPDDLKTEGFVEQVKKIPKINSETKFENKVDLTTKLLHAIINLLAKSGYLFEENNIIKIRTRKTK